MQIEMIDLKSVTDVTPEFLVYTDRNGTERKISLADCAARFAARYRDIAVSPDGQKCVGERKFDSFDSPYAYFELFTEPHLRFGILLKHGFFAKLTGARAKEQKQFLAMQQRLISVGYTTYDIS